ncbi:hypothetical protein [Camelimonas fluminis]
MRGLIYWVRTPDDLRPIVEKLEVRRSLATSDSPRPSVECV